MYSKEIKDRFLNEEVGNAESRYDIENILKRISGFEELKKKDAFNWNSNDIIGFLKWYDSSSYLSLRKVKATLSRYIRFCIDNNMAIDGQNHCDEIRNEVLSTCINVNRIKQSVITRKELLEKIEELPNASDKFILLALFEGINGPSCQEIVQARTSAIKGNTIELYNGREVVISDKLKDLAYEAAAENMYISMADGKEREMYGDSDEIIKRLRQVKNESVIYKVYLRLKKSLDYIGLNESISANDLYDSGKIHFIKDLCAKYNVPEKEWYKNEEIRRGFGEKYGELQFISGFMKKYGEYLE